MFSSHIREFYSLKYYSGSVWISFWNFSSADIGWLLLTDYFKACIWFPCNYSLRTADSKDLMIDSSSTVRNKFSILFYIRMFSLFSTVEYNDMEESDCSFSVASLSFCFYATHALIFLCTTSHPL